jgi:hypothetical protein
LVRGLINGKKPSLKDGRRKGEKRGPGLSGLQGNNQAQRPGLGPTLFLSAGGIFSRHIFGRALSLLFSKKRQNHPVGFMGSVSFSRLCQIERGGVHHRLGAPKKIRPEG